MHIFHPNSQLKSSKGIKTEIIVRVTPKNYQIDRIEIKFPQNETTFAQNIWTVTVSSKIFHIVGTPIMAGRQFSHQNELENWITIILYNASYLNHYKTHVKFKSVYLYKYTRNGNVYTHVNLMRTLIPDAVRRRTLVSLRQFARSFLYSQITFQCAVVFTGKYTNQYIYIHLAWPLK